MVASIQTFGSYANFHPHIHALVTNGVVTREGEYRPLPEWTPGVIAEVFRRLVLRELVKAGRLSEEFRDVLMTWERSGFSVYGEQVVVEGEEERLERVVRYLVRPPMAVGVVQESEEGRVRVQTPVDPRTGERGLDLDPLEWIHALGRQVPDPRQHLVRYYGLYANRSRGRWRSRWQGVGSWSGSGGGSGGRAATGRARAGIAQGSWARLLRRIMEVDPWVCPRCRVTMQVISVLTEPRVVDRILAHVKRGDRDPLEARGPPGEGERLVS
jgi:hypothetical protein